MAFNLVKKRSLLFGNKIIAEADGKKVGSVYYNASGNRGLLDSIKVKKEYRRKGIGDALIKEAIKELEAKGAVKIETFINSFNPEAAKRLLEKNKFERNGEKIIWGSKYPLYRRKGGAP